MAKKILDNIQLEVTKRQLTKLKGALRLPPNSDIDPVIQAASDAGLRSLIQDLQQQVDDFEKGVVSSWL